MDPDAEQRTTPHAREGSPDYRRPFRARLSAGYRPNAQGRPRHHSSYPAKKAQPIAVTQPVVAPIYGDSLELDELVVRVGTKRRYRYLWIAVSRLSRQVLAYFIGDRSRKSLHQLWQRIPRAYRRKLVYTDEYPVYGDVLRPWQHRPSPKGSGRTSVIEGLNNKWRTRVSGLVRRTVCVQSVPDLDERLRLVFNQHNHMCHDRLMKLGWARLSTH